MGWIKSCFRYSEADSFGIRKTVEALTHCTHFNMWLFYICLGGKKTNDSKTRKGGVKMIGRIKIYTKKKENKSCWNWGVLPEGDISFITIHRNSWGLTSTLFYEILSFNLPWKIFKSFIKNALLSYKVLVVEKLNNLQNYSWLKEKALGSINTSFYFLISHWW